MMKQKNLILLCDNYPLSAREFFIDDEMRMIAPKFDKMLIYTASVDSGENLNRFVPANAEVTAKTGNRQTEIDFPHFQADVCGGTILRLAEFACKVLVECR